VLFEHFDFGDSSPYAKFPRKPKHNHKHIMAKGTQQPYSQQIGYYYDWDVRVVINNDIYIPGV
jgi:hypothetical protein